MVLCYFKQASAAKENFSGPITVIEQFSRYLRPKQASLFSPFLCGISPKSSHLDYRQCFFLGPAFILLGFDRCVQMVISPASAVCVIRLIVRHILWPYLTQCFLYSHYVHRVILIYVFTYVTYTHMYFTSSYPYTQAGTHTYIIKKNADIFFYTLKISY